MQHFISKLAIVLFALLPLAASADTIVFENPYVDGERTKDYAWCSGCGANGRVWDTFAIAADTSVNRVDARMWLGGTTQLEYSIWTADRSGLIFAQIFTLDELMINAFGGYTQNDVTALLDGLSLAAGSYSLSIWDLGDRESRFGWYGITGLVDGSGFQSMDSGGSFQWGGGNGRDLAFRLYGTPQQLQLSRSVSVPEPGTFALLGLGLAGLAIGRRRKTIA